MNKNLNRLLESFSDEDWNRFRDFLQSPFFVKGRNYMGFYDLLKENIKGKDDYSQLTSDFIIDHLGENLSTSTLNNRLSELYKLALEFLFQIRTEKDEIGFFATIFEELTERKRFANTNYLYSLVKNKLIPPDSKDYPSYLKMLKSISDYYRSTNDFDNCFRIYNEYNSYFTAYSLEMIMNYTHNYKSINHTVLNDAKEKFNKVFSSIDFKTIIGEFGNDPLYIPVILMFYITQALANDEDESIYLKAFNYLIDNYEALSPDTRLDFNLKMQSHCVRRIMKGDNKFYEHYLDIVKNKLRHKELSFLKLNQYPFTDFHDIVKIALYAGEIDWAEDFVKEYSPMLNPLTRNTDRLSALTSVSIAQKDFTTALRYINEFNKSDNKFHNLEFYVSKIIVLYELNREEEMEQTVNNLYHYVRKHGELENELNKIDLFIKNVNKLKNIKTKTLRKIEDYLQYLENPETNFLHKKWVTEKVKEYVSIAH